MPDEGEVVVRVNNLAGPLCEVSTKPEWIVSDLKRAIARHERGIPAIQQRLLVGLRQLEDREALCTVLTKYEIADILLVRRSPEIAGWLKDVTRCWQRFVDAPPHVRADKEVVLAAVAQQGTVVRFAAKALRADREVMIAACSSDARALAYAEGDTGMDLAVLAAAIARDPGALEHACAAAKADRALVLAAIRQSSGGQAFRYASSAVRADREIALCAVAKDGKMLKFAADSLRSDRGLVLEAVRQNASAIKYASPALRRDAEVCALAGCSSDSDF